MNSRKLYAGQFDQLPMSIVQEQLSFLRQYGVVYFWLHIMSASLLCSLLGMNARANTLLTSVWYTSIILLSIGRWMTNSRFSRSHSLSYEQLVRLIQRYRFFSMMLSMAWGVSGFLLFFDNPTAQAVHVGLLMVVCVSTLPMLIISRTELYIQVVLLMLPIALMLAMQNELKTNLFSTVILAFGGAAFLVTQIIAQVLNHLFDTQQSLLEQVHTDPVTQLINRSHFDHTLKTEWCRAARHGHSLSLLLVEIDDFQKVEAKGGTSSSDQYLRVITHCLRSVARRSSDILARYGRSELIALLPSTALEEAALVAEKLRADVENAQLADPENANKTISVTIGVSFCYPTVAPSDDDRGDGEFSTTLYPAVLLSAADRALQRAKCNGGNQVEREACGENNSSLTTVYRD